jgi:hypothetical protein
MIQNGIVHGLARDRAGVQSGIERMDDSTISDREIVSTTDRVGAEIDTGSS